MIDAVREEEQKVKFAQKNEMTIQGKDYELMTKDEIKQLLAFMASVYTARLMPEINSFTVEVWHRILGDLDFSITKKALMKWVSIEKYPSDTGRHQGDNRRFENGQ